jgi:probable phosphomutase (TIGR03848 family)
MPIILLIRHGETDFVGKRLSGHLPGVHLNSTGKRQADDLAQNLRGAPIKAIYSSPLERALETAFPLSQITGTPIKICQGLSEINFGTWQGKTIKQMHRFKLWKVVVEKPSEMQFPQGETFLEAKERLVTAIDEINHAHAETDLVAVFSHSDSISLLVSHFLNMPLDDFHRVSIDTASISVLSLGKGQPTIRHLNLMASMRIEWPSH